jgi:hypothetical protein
MPNTKKIVKFLGDLLFFLQLSGVPLLILQLYYRGDSVGNWFEGREWYSQVLIVIGIIGGFTFYLWVQFTLKMHIWDILWFRAARWYDAKINQLNVEKKKDLNTDTNVKTNDSNDKTNGRKDNIQERSSGDGRTAKPGGSGGNRAKISDQVPDPNQE